MVLVGHFKNFKLYWGQWQVRKRLTRNKCHHLTWFLKDHSGSPVKLKLKGVKETVGRLFKRPVGKGVYRPSKQERRAALTLWITQKQNVKVWSHFSWLLFSSHFSLLRFASPFSQETPGSVARKERFLLVRARVKFPLRGLAGPWGHLETDQSLTVSTSVFMAQGMGCSKDTWKEQQDKEVFIFCHFFYFLRYGKALWTQQKDGMARERLKMVYHYLMEASPSDFSLLWISLPQSSWTTVHSLQMVSCVSVLVFQAPQENKKGHNVKSSDKSSTYNETVLRLHIDFDHTSPEPRSSHVIHTYICSLLRELHIWD